MKNLLKSLIPAFCASVLLAFSAQAVEIGQPAPDFTLKDSHGQSHSLSDFKGKLVVLEWINHGCPFVVKFYREGHMQAWQEKYAEKGVVWLSICSSAPGEQGHYTAEGWNKKNEEIGGKAAAILIDEDGRVGRLYDARVTPHMYVIDKDGILRYNGAIDSIRSARTADIDRAENYVVAALTALMNGEDVATTTSTPYGCTVKYVAY
ncbi:MAG: thioredoxin family protein [Puniceicoccaceae bacterium]|nr:MAG: thioredoxin family protein [Puniceicoccaceae bacterium]